MSQSSAQAAQSLLRNILGACFPFFGNVSFASTVCSPFLILIHIFTQVMYDHLGFPVASSVVGAIATAFAVVPWILIAYGKRLRKRSSIAVSLELLEGDVLVD
jgi:hypothetical protein